MTYSTESPKLSYSGRETEQFKMQTPLLGFHQAILTVVYNKIMHLISCKAVTIMNSAIEDLLGDLLEHWRDPGYFELAVESSAYAYNSSSSNTYLAKAHQPSCVHTLDCFSAWLINYLIYNVRHTKIQNQESEKCTAKGQEEAAIRMEKTEHYSMEVKKWILTLILAMSVKRAVHLRSNYILPSTFCRILMGLLGSPRSTKHITSALSERRLWGHWCVATFTMQ